MPRAAAWLILRNRPRKLSRPQPSA